ncbi:uncharacterized mitochondrial protein AtMg00810-like [Jatropha curcas]|uniref:uncharacterized mitochondrial protein AtMg00810-like n=1 Tax=Jatropha curcas TaxID=180498 RepID=UPI0009D69880|nr:uncharacterized mitochondrial protein AtMg00810-like [Jatropha curcas]
MENGELEEEVYMAYRLGVNEKLNQEGKVFRLKKSLYGMKQSPRAWFEKFSGEMKSVGYKQSMLDCKPAETPVEVNSHFEGGSNERYDDVGRDQRLVGRLIYLTHTRLDITFAVSKVSQYMHEPLEKYMEAVFQILRYLKGSPTKGILFKDNGNLDISCFTDADWVGDRDTRRSTSRHLTMIGRNLVS